MNIGKSCDVSSSGGREDGAASSDERPHKKARFAWQIKGKYHLKNKTNHPIESSANTLTGSETIQPSADITLSQTVIPLLENDSNTSLLKDVTNTLNQDFNAIPGSTTPMTSTSRDVLQTNVPVTQLSETMTAPEVNSVNICSENGSSPSSIRRPISPRDAQRLRREEDRCISQWQATQTVKGCFDNTINRVLESWMNAPAPTEERFLTLDLAQFMNHLPPADDNIENEGILMAISAHGLQSVPTAQCSQPVANNIPKRDDDSDSSLLSSDFEIPQQKSPPQSSSSSNEHRTHYSYEQSADESNNLESSWDVAHDTNEVPFAIQPDPFQFYGNNSTTDDYNDDFMNTAVLHAIQSKGLVASGTDFGLF